MEVLRMAVADGSRMVTCVVKQTSVKTPIPGATT